MSATTRKGDWIQTFTGRAFWPMDPRQDEIHIEDIAHALSLICRFGGHCLQFYSVAEHSVHVSRQCPRGDALWGLLHDASEAYLIDVPRPIKAFLPGYKETERAIEEAVADRFGLTRTMPLHVKCADNAMLSCEALHLMAPPPAPWTDPAQPASVRLECWPPDEAERRFLEEFRGLLPTPEGRSRPSVHEIGEG